MESIVDIKGVVYINVNLTTGWGAWTSRHIGDYVALLCPCSSTSSAIFNPFPHHHTYTFLNFFSQMGSRLCDHGNRGLVLLRLCGGAMHKEC